MFSTFFFANEIVEMSSVMRKPDLAYTKTVAQISCTVTAANQCFVFPTLIGQSLYFLNLKSEASSHLLWLYSPGCVRPGLKPQRQLLSRRGLIFGIL